MNMRFSSCTERIHRKWSSLAVLCLCLSRTSLFGTEAFSVRLEASSSPSSSSSSDGVAVATSGSDAPNESSVLEKQIQGLKRVLEREYVSFFNPMEREYYAESVSFEDPLTSLSGVHKYQENVDMLASRTLMGKFLFQDAGIVLHSVEGGELSTTNNGAGVAISDITTRWTLRMTVKVLPWKPTARFTGISVYEVQPGGPKGVQILKQNDYWDSINIQQGGKSYAAVDKSIALKDFLGQLSPEVGNANAASSAELPYQLLRRGQDYEVRRYPSYVAVKTKYIRREDAFMTLGSYCQGIVNPLAPSIIEISSSSKEMIWPLTYADPGDENPIDAMKRKASSYTDSKGCEIITVPECVVAVASYSDASVEPVVRRANEQLQASCKRDGLQMVDDVSRQQGKLKFAQYDAVYTMGKRRGEVWIELRENRHPWSS